MYLQQWNLGLTFWDAEVTFCEGKICQLGFKKGFGWPCHNNLITDLLLSFNVTFKFEVKTA